MPSEDTRMLEFNQNQKSDKAPFIIYVELECMIGKIDECINNPENSCTAKVSQQSIKSTISSFGSIINKDDLYRGKHCKKKFWESLREYAMKINFKKNINEAVNKRADVIT